MRIALTAVITYLAGGTFMTGCLVALDYDRDLRYAAKQGFLGAAAVAIFIGGVYSLTALWAWAVK